MIPELLAPAGSSDAFKAAIAAGADAVYLGGRRFGARHFASNFDDPLLAESISYAHLRGVKVYITVNTLIHDDEIPDLAGYLLFLFSIGVDSILIQDIGVLSLAREIFTDLKSAPALHASTQMAIHNQEGALYAVHHGCTRVVLARELPIPEIREISEVLHEHGAEVEIFAHGALCYAYSGQCLLSSIIGGRSGNRGMCAQPCRKPYDIIRGRPDQYGRLAEGRSIHLKDEYLLSTRDLSVYPVLKEIVALPISALKIEGRMRSPSYVATVTNIYRRAIDAIQTGNFFPTRQEETDLILAFSRGFTTGYLNSEEYHRVMGRDLPGRRGILIGTVKEVTYRGIIVQPAGDVIPEHGDGMVCITDIEEEGFVLRHDASMRGTVMEIETNARCNQGDQIYLTGRGRTTKAAESLMQDPDRRYFGSILLDIQMVIDPEGGIRISGNAKTRTGVQISYSFRSTEKLIPARSRPLTSELIIESMRKTGGTLFSIQKIKVDCPDGLFAPMSMLNGIRREILDQIETQILNVSIPSPEDITIVSKRTDMYLGNNTVHSEGKLFPEREPGLIGIVSDTISLQASLAAKTDRVYIEWYPEPSVRDDANILLDTVLEWITENPDLQERVGIKLPKILRRKDLDIIYALLPRIITAGVQHIMVDGVGIADVLAHFKNDFQFAGFSGLNITNHLSLKSHSEFDLLTLSCELSGSETASTLRAAFDAGIRAQVAIIGQGLLEAMITEDHLAELANMSDPAEDRLGLKDHKSQVFPIITDPAGRTHIFNAAETSLIDRIPEIRQIGVGMIILDTRWRDEEYTKGITTIWREALSIPSSEWDNDITEWVKKEVRIYAHGGLTSGTWKRGLSGG